MVIFHNYVNVYQRAKHLKASSTAIVFLGSPSEKGDGESPSGIMGGKWRHFQ